MISFELTTPERIAFRADAVSVTLPTTEGEITVLQNHIPLLAVLASGMVTVKKSDGTEEYLAVGGGFVQVSSFAKAVVGAAPTRVVVLADTADRSEELSVEAVEAARARAKKTLQEASRNDEATYALATAALEREIARLRVAHKRRHR